MDCSRVLRWRWIHHKEWCGRLISAKEDIETGFVLLLFSFCFGVLHNLEIKMCVAGSHFCNVTTNASPVTQRARGGGGLQSPTSQHGSHQNRRTRQGLVYCFTIATHSHKRIHKLIWVVTTECQKIAICKAVILSRGPCVFSAGGGGLIFKTTHEVEDSTYEVDSPGGRGVCTWHRSLVLAANNLNNFRLLY